MSVTYAVLQMVAAHAAWASSRVPTKSMTMTTFFYTLLPNELAPLAAVVHAAALLSALRRMASSQGTTTSSTALAVGAVVNAGVLAFHLRSAIRNAGERVDVIAELDKAGIPHPLAKGISWADWVRLSLFFPLYFFSGKDVAVHRNISYLEPGVRAPFQNRLDVFVRRDQAQRGPAPVFLYVHGGGWIISDKVFVPYSLFATLLRRGWIVVCCNYRLAPGVPMAELVTDVKRALAWTKSEGCARFGGDPNAVAVGGESAGGHLSLTVALTGGDASYQPGFEGADTRVMACLDLYGVHDITDEGGHFAVRDQGAFVDFMATQVMQAPLHSHRPLWERYSPRALLEAADVESIPSIFGVHGVLDNLVPVNDARDFYKRLRQLRPAEDAVFIELATAHHCFNWLPSPRTMAYDEAAAAFLANVHVRRQQK